MVIDAWFGFQPLEVLDSHLATAGIDRAIEIWCHAPDAVVAERYRSRLADRSPGHPGDSYIPELIVLNGRATPTGRAPVFDVDTSAPIAIETLMTWVQTEMRRENVGPHAID